MKLVKSTNDPSMPIAAGKAKMLFLITAFKVETTIP
jgi:hypothetical protein